MKTHFRNILNTFLTGALAALPLFATVLIVIWSARFLYDFLGPNSAFGSALKSIGFGMAESELVVYLIGAAMTLAAIFLLGVLVRTGLNKFLLTALDALMQRIPFVRNIYELAKTLVDLLRHHDSERLKSMSPVWLHFGGAGGVAVLGLLSTPEPILMGDKLYMAVLVPTAPIPVGGGLLYVPQEWVTDADVGVDGLTSIYVSMGITSHQYIGHKKSAAPAPEEK